MTILSMLGTIAAFICLGIAIADRNWFASIGWLFAGLLQLWDWLRKEEAP